MKEGLLILHLDYCLHYHLVLPYFHIDTHDFQCPPKMASKGNEIELEDYSQNY